jgi:hypothetical protein
VIDYVLTNETEYFASARASVDTVNRDIAPGNFSVSDLSLADDRITRGDGIDVSATVTNTASERGRQTVELRTGGTTLASESVTLDAGENTTVEFTGIDTSALGPGNQTYGVYTVNDNQTARLTVTVYASGSTAAEYDNDGDGQIDIGELGSAAEAFSAGNLSVSQLGNVAEAFAAS